MSIPRTWNVPSPSSTDLKDWANQTDMELRRFLPVLAEQTSVARQADQLFNFGTIGGFNASYNNSILLSDNQNPALWTATSGTVTESYYASSSWIYDDGDASFPGTYKGLKHESPVDIASTIHRLIPPTDFLTTKDCIGLNFFLDPGSPWSEADITLNLYSDGTNINNNYASIDISLGSEHWIKGHWNKMVIAPVIEQTTVVGIVNWKSISGIGLTITPRIAGTQSRVFWGPIYLVRSPSTKGAIVITFDDGFRSVYDEAFSYMSQKGYRGTAFVSGHYVEQGITPEGFPGATWKMLFHMYQSGWDIGNHGFTHKCLQWLDLATQENDVSANVDWLLKNGFVRSSRVYAYPNYRADQKSWKVVPKYCAIARAGQSEAKAEATAVYPFKDPYHVPSFTITSDTTQAEWRQRMQWAADNNLVQVFCFHHVGATLNSWGEINQATFRSFIDDIMNYSLDVITFSDILNHNYDISTVTNLQTTLTNLQTTLNAKAPLDSPTFTGIPTAPSPVVTDDSQKLATTGWVKDNLAFRGVLAQPTANLDVPALISVKVVFGATTYDTSSFWTISAPTRITIPSGVTRVRLTGQVGFTNIDSSAAVYCAIMKNDLAIPTGVNMGLLGLINGNLSTPVLSVVTGDYFELGVYCSMATTLGTTATWLNLQVIE